MNQENVLNLQRSCTEIYRILSKMDYTAPKQPYPLLVCLHIMLYEQLVLSYSAQSSDLPFSSNQDVLYYKDIKLFCDTKGLSRQVFSQLKDIRNLISHRVYEYTKLNDHVCLAMSQITEDDFRKYFRLVYDMAWINYDTPVKLSDFVDAGTRYYRYFSAKCLRKSNSF